MAFDRNIYFNSVRTSLFGSMSSNQVDGQEAILTEWEIGYPEWDIRWLAYALATTFHETSTEMWPIEEYGKGSGADYGKPDPETGQCYYGRGFVQLTWRDNYRKADQKIGLQGPESCEWHAENALDLAIAAEVMFRGMEEGWFRINSNTGMPETLSVYFNDTRDDPFGAREIINGDKNKVPSWSNGVSIGNLIKGYHEKFLQALEASFVEDFIPPLPPPETKVIFVQISGVPKGYTVEVAVEDPDADGEI